MKQAQIPIYIYPSTIYYHFTAIILQARSLQPLN